MPNKATWGDATTDEAPEYGDLVEKGDYPATIEKTEAKISNSSGNKYYQLQWRLDNNRVVFHPIYLVSANQDWLQKQFNSLKRIFMIAGLSMPQKIPTPTEMNGLVGIKMSIKVDIEKGQNGYNDKNKVLDTFPIEGIMQSQTGGGIEEDIDIDEIPF